MSCTFPQYSDTPIRPVPPVESTRAKHGARTLADLTTFGVGGPIGELLEAASEEEMKATVARADAEDTPLLVVGGGSNILGSDAGFPGIVLRDLRTGIRVEREADCEGAIIWADAGLPWDQLVVHTIAHEWAGLEALSGIPGSVGAAPVQNIGAYGQEIAETIYRVRVYDREAGYVREIPAADMKFGYRASLLKRTIGDRGPSPRYIVLSVGFQFRISNLSNPIAYGQLAGALGAKVGDRVPSVDVRAAVLEIRASKGMVLDDADRDTYSAGSFFTNPVIPVAEVDSLPEGAPRYPVYDGALYTLQSGAPVRKDVVKTSAAWLIDHAGFTRGYNMPGPAAVSTKHALALTNRGGATGAQVRALAREIQAGVRERFGITLQPEPVVLGGLGA